MAATDRVKAWRVLKPLFTDAFNRLLEAEKASVEVLNNVGFSYENYRKQVAAPIRIALLEELPETLERELRLK